MFSADKILHEVIYLLSLNNGRMNLLKLIKELYLIDRESISERDTSISGDIFFSMPHGPVLSQTLNMLTDLPHNNWGNYLEGKPTKYYDDIIIKKYAEPNLLSEKDKEYIQKISKNFSESSEWDLEGYTHKLPEWKDPKGSSQKIKYYDIMKALGRTNQEIQEAKEEYEAISEMFNYLES